MAWHEYARHVNGKCAQHKLMWTSYKALLGHLLLFAHAQHMCWCCVPCANFKNSFIKDFHRRLIVVVCALLAFEWKMFIGQKKKRRDKGIMKRTESERAKRKQAQQKIEHVTCWNDKWTSKVVQKKRKKINVIHLVKKTFYPHFVSLMCCWPLFSLVSIHHLEAQMNVRSHIFSSSHFCCRW